MQKIKTALLSYGMSGKVFHAPFIKMHEGFELVGSWERNKKLIHLDYPTVKSYSSIEELLADGIDLVIVNTPIDTHYEYAKQVLNAGKHALVEKAFTTTAKEAQELKDLAQEKGLKLVVYQNRRWDSDFKTVKSVLDEKILGEIIEAEIRFDRYNPILSPKKWKESNNAGAGILKDLGPHIIDQALCLFGFPIAVFADIRTVREHSEVNDNIDILLYYDDKRVRLHAGFFNKEQFPGFTLQGRNGSFLKARADIQEDVLKAGAKPNIENWGKEPKEKEGLLNINVNGETIRKTIPTLNGNYYDFFEAVYESITQNKTEPVTAEDGLKVMQIIEAAIESSNQKKVISLN
ncbi:Gfo/Idh/MocA family oxidoreductase [Flavobacterium ponti]|uniref:Gfo/Idh/MocA family oxidoreductase n=1 Tax=Flavobacterium ponti TaxID=665133 RepID=A0ABV9P5G3_9FLAO